MPTPRRLPPPAGRVAILVCAALLASCGPENPQGDTPEAVQNNASGEISTLPVAEPPLDRERLLLAAFRAASAFAAGADDSAAQRQLDGKRFELRFRFGCGAADSQDESRGWRFDESDRTLRLRVTPDLLKEAPAVARIAQEFEGVEGLWLRRPWLLPAACPKKPAAAPAAEQAGTAAPDEDRPEEDAAASTTEPAGWRVGVAQFFTSADPRTARRRQRPYEVTKVLEEGQQPSAQGYDFVLSGRLRALPDRRVIACSGNDPQSPPDCVISVHVDRSWIERPDNKELLAEWSG